MPLSITPPSRTLPIAVFTRLLFCALLFAQVEAVVRDHAATEPPPSPVHSAAAEFEWSSAAFSTGQEAEVERERVRGAERARRFSEEVGEEDRGLAREA